MLSFFLSDHNATLPKRGSSRAAGLDICANDFGVVPCGKRVLVKTGVFLAECPTDMYLRIAPRSKLANKHGIDVLAGVVDADYRGEISIILYNTSNVDFTFDKSQAIAQLIPEQLRQVEVYQALVLEIDTSRGDKGTLSSGVNPADEGRKTLCPENLCDFCINDFATCKSKPEFADIGDGVIKCEEHREPF